MTTTGSTGWAEGSRGSTAPGEPPPAKENKVDVGEALRGADATGAPGTSHPRLSHEVPVLAPQRSWTTSRARRPRCTRRPMPSGPCTTGASSPWTRRSTSSPTSMDRSTMSSKPWPDHLGRILDPVLEQVTDPPPRPVASNVEGLRAVGASPLHPGLRRLLRLPRRNGAPDRVRGRRGRHRARRRERYSSFPCSSSCR